MAGETTGTLGRDAFSCPERQGAVSGRPRWPGLIVLGVVLAGSGASLPDPGPEPPRYHPLLLDCAAYRTRRRSEILVQAGRQRTHESIGRDGVMILRAGGPDSLIQLEAWFDTLSLWREGSGERLEPDTDGLVGGRYRGTLTGLGGFASTDTPFIPDEVAEVADLSGALADLLPQLPPAPLAPGRSWRDDLGTVITRIEDGSVGTRPVERYRLLRRSTRQESRLLPDSTEVSASRIEGESGVFSWSGELGVLRWERDLTDEVTVPVGGLVKQAFKTRIEQKVTVERVASGGECR